MTDRCFKILNSTDFWERLNEMAKSKRIELRAWAANNLYLYDVI
jgi:hypothetical protein